MLKGAIIPPILWRQQGALVKPGTKSWLLYPRLSGWRLVAGPHHRSQPVQCVECFRIFACVAVRFCPLWSLLPENRALHIRVVRIDRNPADHR